MATQLNSASATANTTLTGSRLLLARLGWVITAGLFLLALVVIAPNHPRQMLFDPLIEDSYQLLAELMDYRAYIRYLLFLRYLVAGFFFLVAVFIFWRKSNDWLAMLTSTAMICLPYIILFSGILYETTNQYESENWLMIVDGTITAIGFLSIPLLLFYFPDGHLVPHRLRKPVIGLFILLTIMVLIPQGLDLPWTGDIWSEISWFVVFVIFSLLILLGIFGQFFRYLRVSTPAQRQQTKWIVFALLANLLWVGFVALRAGDSLRFQAASIYGLFELHATLVVVALIPISLAISLLRYHLYDIDLIIRRTIIYGTLTLILGTIYLTTIIVLQDFVRIQTGGDSPLVIVISTLGIATLFNPLRTRIQNFIDRRFYRQKYDAQRAIERFTSLSQSEFDQKRLAGELIRLIEETIHPEQTSLWLINTKSNTQPVPNFSQDD